MREYLLIGDTFIILSSVLHTIKHNSNKIIGLNVKNIEHAAMEARPTWNAGPVRDQVDKWARLSDAAPGSPTLQQVHDPARSEFRFPSAIDSTERVAIDSDQGLKQGAVPGEVSMRGSLGLVFPRCIFPTAGDAHPKENLKKGPGISAVRPDLVCSQSNVHRGPFQAATL